MLINDVIQVNDRGIIYYLGVLEPAQISQLTFVPCEVPVASLNKILVIRHQDGYQREGDVKRMERIKNHYANSEHSLIPPVVLSTRGKWKFKAYKSGGSIGIIEAEDCAAIIDGQHRLGGLSLLAEDTKLDAEQKARKIPFMAVDFDAVAVEKEQFEIINDEQKGIPKSHLKFINKGGSFNGIVASALREAEDSVFAGRIGIAKRADWDLITFGAAEEIVAMIFDAFFCQNAFRPDQNKESQSRGLRIALNYWQAVAENFPELWSDMALMPAPQSPKTSLFPGRSKFKYRLLEETGLRAFARLGSRVLHRAYIPATEDIAWENVSMTLSRMASDDLVTKVMRKKTMDNITELVLIDPELQYAGKAGVNALWRVLEGALVRAQ